MSFISFSMDFYDKELQNLETAAVNDETIYRAKQLLKMLDDLMDEGYTELNQKLEEVYQGVSRLRRYLRDNHAEPFPVCQSPLAEAQAVYEQKSFELAEAIEELIENAEKSTEISDNTFLKELMRFCEWVGYEENTAYIFLLRDTLLPYIAYQRKNRKNIYPWLLGRKTLAKITGKEAVDDEIRASVIKALESGKCRNYEAFCGVVLPDIRAALKKYPEAENCLTALLEEIKEKRIIVVESGCSGTLPMLLKSLDDRVDMRMYTTYPYLLEVYDDNIYSQKYEENRLFETLYSQDLYFQFSDFKDGHFFVRKCANREVEKKAFAEIKTILHERGANC